VECRVPPKLSGTALDKLVTKLTTGDDTPARRCERAIALFEFQVELVYPGRRLGAEKANPQSRERRYEAAMFATVKLLEKAQSDLEARLGREPKLNELTEDPLFAALYDGEFVEQGGFAALRYNRSAKTFTTAFRTPMGRSRGGRRPD
jgi:hypothetical protein